MGFTQAGVQPAAEKLEPRPVWSFDLGDGAYRQYVGADARVQHAQIAFIGDNTIAVSFLARDPAKSGLRLQCIVIHSTSHNIQKSLTWTTPYKDFKTSVWADHRWVSPTNHGEFLVFTGSKLIRYNGSFEALQQRTVADPLKTTFILSPMRNLLLVSNFVQTGRFTETIVHTDNLNDDKDFGDGTRSSSAIADSGEVIRMSINWRGKVLSGCRTALSDWDSGSRKTDCSPQRSANGQSAYICTSSSSCRAIASQISGIPAFIKNDIIFEPGTSNNTFALLDSTGKVISRGSYGNVGKESGQGPISRDAVCRRFSFGSGYARVSPLSAAISTIERVHVFDVSVMKPLLTLTFQAKGDDPFPSFDHALSPDGIRLGILRDTTLEVYRLPELPAQ